MTRVELTPAVDRTSQIAARRRKPGRSHRRQFQISIFRRKRCLQLLDRPAPIRILLPA